MRPPEQQVLALRAAGARERHRWGIMHSQLCVALLLPARCVPRPPDWWWPALWVLLTLWVLRQLACLTQRTAVAPAPPPCLPSLLPPPIHPTLQPASTCTPPGRPAAAGATARPASPGAMPSGSTTAAAPPRTNAFARTPTGKSAGCCCMPGAGLAGAAAACMRGACRVRGRRCCLPLASTHLLRASPPRRPRPCAWLAAGGGASPATSQQPLAWVGAAPASAPRLPYRPACWSGVLRLHCSATPAALWGHARSARAPAATPPLDAGSTPRHAPCCRLPRLRLQVTPCPAATRRHP